MSKHTTQSIVNWDRNLDVNFNEASNTDVVLSEAGLGCKLEWNKGLKRMKPEILFEMDIGLIHRPGPELSVGHCIVDAG